MTIVDNNTALYLSSTLIAIVALRLASRFFNPPAPEFDMPRAPERRFSHRQLTTDRAPPPSVSPTTGNPVPDYYLHASSVHFQDTSGRSVLLRGVNLSGGAKNPPQCPSWSQDGFWEDAESGKSNWVNSTLNIDDGSADVHLARLRAWGFNMLRFVFTWEALEHEGPGTYDEEYMEYVVKCLYKCKEYGFRVFMDPHQDVWSRFSGGSGAPLWTIYACGVDPHMIVPTHSALVHADYPSKEHPDPKSLPSMIWASNYYRAFGHTVWTLFFAGKTYAPKCIIDGVNIQDWLQDHFVNAVGALAHHISTAGGLFEECVVGWDSLNEPAEGLIGVKDIRVVPKEQSVRLGPVPTPLENMRIANGEAIEVPNFSFGGMGPYNDGTKVLDPKGNRLWLTPEADRERGAGRWGWVRGPEWKVGECIWAQHGVWDPATGKALKPTYFHTLPTDPNHYVEYVADFWRQHWMSYASTVRTFHPEAIHFMNTTVFKPLPELPESFLGGRACSTAHYYDGLTLMTKHWSWYNADALGILRGKYWSIAQGLRVGEANIRKSFQEQLGIIKQDTKESLGAYPTLIGEIGCPYDMDGKKAYGYIDDGKGKGNYSSQTRAWDASINACDGPNVLNYTLWTYVPGNSHEWSDNWNGEDLSLWSYDDTRAANSNPSYYTMRSSDSTAFNPSTSLLESTSVASSQTLTPRNVSPKGIASGREVSAQLILDGARAITAICRPYPVYTVGCPERIDFDVKTSTFKLHIRVGPQDTGGKKTEIYVPFVHFAQSLDWDTNTTKQEDQLSRNSSKSDMSVYDEEQMSPTLERNGGPSTPPPSNGGLELDIAVKMSIGTFTTAGQYLTWTYPIPRKETTYSIEIRRAGGAMKMHSTHFEAVTWADTFCGMSTFELGAMVAQDLEHVAMPILY